MGPSRAQLRELPLHGDRQTLSLSQRSLCGDALSTCGNLHAVVWHSLSPTEWSRQETLKEASGRRGALGQGWSGKAS